MDSLTHGAFDVRNRVLGALSPAARAFLIKRSVTRPMSAGEVFYEDGMPFTHAVFPHEGVLSLMSDYEGGRNVEKASIGLEGFVGLLIVMGGGVAISRSVVQVPGYATWVAISDIDNALEKYECVRQAMFRYAQSFIRQLMESIACNSLHSAEQRVCRWLLHAHDRVAGDQFMITQQAVADILGLRRATVSDICSRLQNVGALSYSRGSLTITDRVALESRSCACYSVVRQSSLL